MNWKICGNIGDYTIIYSDSYERIAYNVIKTREQISINLDGGYFSLASLLNMKGFSIWEAKELAEKIKKELENI